MNLTNMVDLWVDRSGRVEVPKSVTYRATSPLYAGEKYRVLLDEEEGNVSEVKIVDSFGNVGMRGSIESF